MLFKIYYIQNVYMLILSNRFLKYCEKNENVNFGQKKIE